MNWLRRFGHYLHDERWARTVGVISALLISAPDLADIVTANWSKVETDRSIISLAAFAASLVIEGGVWAKRTVEQNVDVALHTPVPTQEAPPAVGGMGEARADLPPADAAVGPVLVRVPGARSVLPTPPVAPPSA